MDINILERLCMTPGVSGREDRRGRVAQELVAPFVDRTYFDVLGNLVAVKEGRDPGPTVLLAAHMDEIGFLVTRVEKDGRIRFAPIGYVDPKHMPGQAVVLYDPQTDGAGDMPGMIQGKVIAFKELDKGHPAPTSEFHIEIGASSLQEVLDRGVKVGTVAAFERRFLRMGDAGYIAAPALDNVAGVHAMIEALREVGDVPGTIRAVATTQEETGLRGARVAGFAGADFCICLDVSFATDIDEDALPRDISSVRLGGGPAVVLMDKGSFADQRTLNLVDEAAKKAGVKVQYQARDAGRTDGSEINVSREGIRTVTVGVPVRYLHTPLEMCKTDDQEGTIKFVAELVRTVQRR